MPILEFRKAPAGEEYERERELEIKRILTELEIGFEVIVEIKCKITTYRSSFEYFRNQINIDTRENRRFAFLKTINPNQWIIRRTK